MLSRGSSDSDLAPARHIAILFLAFLLLSGCSGKSPAEAQIRRLTHEIAAAIKSVLQGEPKRSRSRSVSQPSAPRGNRKPELAIILDDLGNDSAAADACIALPFDVTLSVLPDLPLSTHVAEAGRRKGKEILLHLPMQSNGAQPEGPEKPEENELRVGMAAGEVDAELAAMLATVPHAVGVNNHEGSRATADSALMQALMPALRRRGLFFIDSRTTPATVAYQTAENSGVPAASRKVFLDDTITSDAIRGQLELAARDAIRDGSAIAIGHPHPATISVLSSEHNELTDRGIKFVFASDLVH